MTIRTLTTRREVLRIGAAGALAAAGFATLPPRAWAFGPGTIVLTPEETEGPYFVEEKLNRSDIRSDPSDKSVQAGHPLSLEIHVDQLHGNVLAPVQGALVDIWHCNAFGVYSDVSQQRTEGKRFLRGAQASDKNGNVKFTTVYPGWYNGRTVHIHVKVRLRAQEKTTYEFTTQFFFDDKLSDKIFAGAPYNQRPRRDVRNVDDGIYSNRAGSSDHAETKGALLTVKLADDTAHASGKYNLVLDLSRKSSGGPGRFGPPPGGGFGGRRPGFGPPPGPPPDGPPPRSA